MKHPLKKPHFKISVSLAALISCAACWVQPPADDAGDESYFRQAVPIIQGRKIRGHSEVKLLKDLSAITSRTTVLRALMNKPDYISHWSHALVDDLQVQREGSRALNPCYGNALRAGAPDGNLALSIMGGSVNTPISPAFNMTDVLNSALVLDNVAPLYEAHLYAMESKPGYQPPLAARDVVGATFSHVYLNRQMLCMGCHNSEYSLSGEASGWDRTHPIQGYFERALFGSASGAPTDTAYAMFRTDVISGPLSPWGMSSCGTFKTSVVTDPYNKVAQFADIVPGQQITIHDVRSRFDSGVANLELDGLQRLLPPNVQATCDFCDANCNGVTVDIEAIANNATGAAAVKTLLTGTDWNPNANGNQTCLNCHGGQAGLSLSAGTDWANELIGVDSVQNPAMKRVDPGNAANSYLIQKLEGTGNLGQMPLGGTALSVAQVNTIKTWINSMPPLSACGVCATTNCTQPKNYVNGNEAFAFLTAVNVVDNVWAEAMGTPLTIGNYFPRNASEHQALRDLTEFHFIPQDWSIKSVLVRAMTSGFFNRKAPLLTSATSAYVVPPILDPWIEADPRVLPVSDPNYVPANNPENHLNGMGEGIYRYGARSLINSVSKAMGWPEPQRFPPNINVYGNEQLQRAMGQYFSETSVGSQSSDLQSLLYWENIHGACVKPSGVGTDWIDRLVTEINNVSPGDPLGPVTVKDAVETMRDWFLGSAVISNTTAVGMVGTEESALANYFGVANLSAPVSSVAGLAGKLRGYCGVLVESPLFMLAGIAELGQGPKPRLRVCNSPPCTYLEMCQDLASSINVHIDNGTLICGADSVGILPSINPPDELWYDWCIGPGCGLLVDFVPDICYSEVFRAPRGASQCMLEPPACDVRYAELGNCGGPMPATVAARGETPLTLAWLEGETVRDAQGAMVRFAGESRFVSLTRGTRLRFGDLLALPVGASLEIDGAQADILTPRGGVPRGMPRDLLFISVTGEEAVRQQNVQEGITIPVDHIRRVQRGWASRGEAGNPLTAQDFRSWNIPREELP